MTRGADEERFSKRTRATVAGSALEHVQPIVLVGGASKRFGQDKLLARVDESGRVLVSFPVQALREVFGPRVKLVGACDPLVHAHADGFIVDVHPGVGPIGGIASALAEWGGPIMVLAGDMPWFGAADVRATLAGCDNKPGALAVLAESAGRLHPCAGVYRPGALPHLEARIQARRFRLMDALPAESIACIALPERATANINRLEDLA